jgi:aminomethyltransferase
MIRTTPFHERTDARNETQLWSHWSGHLAADRYQMSDKMEYFAVRNAAGVFDSSPLYKYWIRGRDATAFLAGVLARDIRACLPGQAQYTCWLDDRGFVIEDGVILHTAADEYLLTSAEPNFAYFADRIGRLEVTIEEVSDDVGTLAIQGPRSRDLLKKLVPQMEKIPYFGVAKGEIGGAAVTVSRTGYTGDLGYEVWCPPEDAVPVWDAIWESTRGYGVLPFGMQALYMTRIEAGLLLLDVDFASSRFAWTDADRATPVELGLTWMLRGIEGTDRVFTGARAIRKELAQKSSRFRTTGIVVDYQHWNRLHDEAGLIPPMDHTPIQEEMFLYDDEGEQVGFATSFMYSPVLQRHIGIARVPLASAAPGSKVNLEIPINHRYVHVAAQTARLPHYNPQRKTA